MTRIEEMQQVVRKENLVEVAEALARHEVRYLFAGGMAVLAHGYLRTTMDIDIVVGLSSENIRAAFRALESVGYRPRQPITAEQFADEELRESWRREKHMLVLQFWADDKPGVDVFVYEPFDFEAELAKALIDKVNDATDAPFVTVETLLEMKRDAGRDKDLIDIEALNRLYEA
jgi:hypothetical protein